MTNRCIGQDVFKKIVEMAYEMGQADMVDLWCIDRISVAQAVASRSQEELVSRKPEMVLKRDSTKKERTLIVSKRVCTGVEENSDYGDGYGVRHRKVIDRRIIIGTYKYLQKKELYDDICAYLLEHKKATQSYTHRKQNALLCYNIRRDNPYDKKEQQEEYNCLLQKIYNVVV